MTPTRARVAVFAASFCILVVEIEAARLLAPFVGVTLETFTAVIAVILAGIAVGSAVGGRAADRRDPLWVARLGFLVSGALTVVSVPLGLILGPAFQGSGGFGTLFITALVFTAPAAAASVVSPAMAKAQVLSLSSTGQVVGGLSAVSTAGALAGSVTTGFFLNAFVPTTWVLIGTGVALVICGFAVLPRSSGSTTSTTMAVVAGFCAVGLSAFVPSPCDTETTYYCAAVDADPTNSSGRTLVLDGLRHSYVDLADPAHLEFRYIQYFASALEERDTAVLRDVVHLGGGGFTMPRWLRAQSDSIDSVVLEVDPALVHLNTERLGLELGNDISVRIGDGRLTMAELPTDSADVVIGDAFGSLAVPWHLTTLEFHQEIRRVLRPDGIYMMNIIDYGDLAFLRAQIATLELAYPAVAILTRPADLEGDGGNFVIITSAQPIPSIAIARRAAATHPATIAVGSGTSISLQSALPHGLVLRDDFAPVDRLIGSPN